MPSELVIPLRPDLTLRDVPVGIQMEIPAIAKGSRTLGKNLCGDLNYCNIRPGQTTPIAAPEAPELTLN